MKKAAFDSFKGSSRFTGYCPVRLSERTAYCEVLEFPVADGGEEEELPEPFVLWK